METDILNALIFFGIAILFTFFRPKKVNAIFGYRTPRSKKNLRTWNYAQKLSSSLLLVFTGSILLLTLVLEYLNIMFNVVIVLILPSFILTILIVEYKLWFYDKN